MCTGNFQCMNCTNILMNFNAFDEHIKGTILVEIRFLSSFFKL